MVLVVVARNGVLFLVAWEVMALASFFLVTFEHEKRERPRGRLDLPGRHAPGHGVPAGHVRPAWRRDRLARLRRLRDGRGDRPGLVGPLFLLAVVGFGTKAGFMPLHVWLPEAHPAAPSHVSAVMSGVMIKTGIYGLVRVLIVPRAAAGVVGLAAGRHRRDLGRPGRALCPGPARPQAAAGLPQRGEHRHHRARARPRAAGRRHGHARAGRPRVRRRAAARAQPRALQGPPLPGRGRGAARRRARGRSTTSAGCCSGCPGRAPAFLVGAAAISGLPPLNGFVSEFLIYLGAFLGRDRGRGAGGDPGLGARHDRRAGADRRAGGGLLHQGLRHRLPRRAAQRPCRGTRTRRAGDAVADG